MVFASKRVTVGRIFWMVLLLEHGSEMVAAGRLFLICLPDELLLKKVILGWEKTIVGCLLLMFLFENVV